MLIGGVNPEYVTHITWKKGCRYGEHPLKNVFFKRKYPFLHFLGFNYTDSRDSYEPALVIVWNNYTILREFTCSSNSHAKSFLEILNSKMQAYYTLKLANNC